MTRYRPLVPTPARPHEVERAVGLMGPGANAVPQASRALDDAPSDRELFTEMWPEICAEGTTYDAASPPSPNWSTWWDA